jgi:Ca2+-binding RTX toxin-like protein
MANVQGTPERDRLIGTDGDDVIEALDGNDYLSGGLGNDILRGGDGNDEIRSDVGSDQLDGEAGDDYIIISNFHAGTTIVTGGGGEDRLAIDAGAEHVIRADLGAGADVIQLGSLRDGARAELTLGEGADTVLIWRSIGATPIGAGQITIRDFEPGPDGDRLDWLEFLDVALTGWDRRSNPFATGHLRLVQAGVDAVLEIDRNGGGDGFITLITFENVSAAAFAFENFDGFPPDGSIPLNLVFTGTDLGETLIGSMGADLIDGLDGQDFLYGGAGDDLIRSGGGGGSIYGELGNDRLEGGADGVHLDGGRGNDELYGGHGNDYLRDQDGDDLMAGGGGDDRIDILRGSLHPSDTVTVVGGDGKDKVWIQSESTSRLIIDGATGDDWLDVYVLGGVAEVTLGTGVDTIVLLGQQSQYLLRDGSIVVGDFAAGAGGDIVRIDQLPQAVDFDNPFASGALRLVADGAHALMQSALSGAWRTIVTFSNVAAESLTAENFGGFAPDGSLPPGVTIEGTSGDDTLSGTAGADIITGLGGSDSIDAGAGGDVIRGGEGSDRIDAGSGDDLVDAGDGDDSVDDGRGDDIIFLGAGKDRIFSNYGSDLIDGGDGDDQILIQRLTSTDDRIEVMAGGGADWIDLNQSGGATAIVDAGDGDDNLSLSGLRPHLRLTLGGGSDRIRFDGINYSHGFAGSIRIADFAVGESGDRLQLGNFLLGHLSNWDLATNPFETGHVRFVQSGRDALLQIDRDGGNNAFATLATLAGMGANALTAFNTGYELPHVTGTAGDDVFVVDEAGDAILELPGGGTDEVVTALAAFALGANVENLTGSGDSPHDLRGNALENLLTGGGGNDVLRLHDGGSDTARGLGGNDILFYGAALTGTDVNDGGEGVDTLVLQGAYAALVLGAASLVGIEGISLQSGSMVRWGGSGADRHDYALTTVQANVAPGQQLRVNAQSLLAGEDFSFDGSAETDGGRFLLYGGFGTDILTGGTGNDIFFFEAGRLGASDRVIGGGGNDAVVVSGGGGAGVARVTVESGTLSGVEALSLNGRFASAPESAPSYEVVLKNGNVASGATLIVNGSSLGEAQALSFDGSAVADGRLRIFGGAGGDVLRGGTSGDSLTGGEGADLFRYGSAAESTFLAPDLIEDFRSGTDRIDLSLIDADSSLPGRQSFVFQVGEFTGGARQLRALQDGEGGRWTIRGDVDGDGNADLVIEVFVAAGQPLAAGDFIL